jgi:hypothetical protein
MRMALVRSRTRSGGRRVRDVPIPWHSAWFQQRYDAALQRVCRATRVGTDHRLLQRTLKRLASHSCTPDGEQPRAPARNPLAESCGLWHRRKDNAKPRCPQQTTRSSSPRSTGLAGISRLYPHRIYARDRDTVSGAALSGIRGRNRRRAFPSPAYAGTCGFPKLSLRQRAYRRSCLATHRCRTRRTNFVCCQYPSPTAAEEHSAATDPATPRTPVSRLSCIRRRCARGGNACHARVDSFGFIERLLCQLRTRGFDGPECASWPPLSVCCLPRVCSPRM